MLYSKCCNDMLLFLEENLRKQPGGYVLGDISRGLNGKYNDEELDETLIQLYQDDVIDGISARTRHFI